MVAPEEALLTKLKAESDAEITTFDLQRKDVDVQGSLTELEFMDSTFDIVICSHVLEHVPEDKAAMREMARVLRPSGSAYIMVPLRGTTTDEDDSVVTEDERLRRFGLEDHVRFYGLDIEQRLEECGLKVDIQILPKALGLPLCSAEKLGIEAKDVVFHCMKEWTPCA